MKKALYKTCGIFAFLLIISSISGNELKAQIANQSVSATLSVLCDGSGTTVTTAGSETGIVYWLRDDADSSVVDGPVTGTGSGISFNTGNLSSTTSFHVYAELPGMAMDFDGLDDIVTTSSVVTWDNTSTLMCWYKSADVSSGAVFAWGSPQVNNYAYLDFRYVSTSFNFVRFYKPGTSYPSIQPQPNAPTDWHHVAIVQTGSATNLYLDGQQVGTGLVPSPTNPTQTSLGAGLFNGSIQGQYDGLIDDLSYWDTPLSQSQIQQYSSTVLNGNEPNLTLYYSFDSISGTTLPDLSSGSNNGLMTNMSANPLVPGIVKETALMNQIVTVTVNSLPTVVAGSAQTVCEGDTITLSGSGASTYSWDNSVTDGSPFVPTATTTYTVTGTDGNGCMNTDNVTITFNAAPSVSAGSNDTICPGDTVTLNGSGASTYTWDNSVSDGVAFVPTATTTYTVTGTDGNTCTATSQVTVMVRIAPNVNAGSAQMVCDGDSVTLSGSGASTYAWDNGIADGVSFLPTTSTTYTVTGTDADNCVNTSQVTVTVNALPNVNAGSAQVVCDGDAATLAGSGASTYVWDNGVTDGLAFTPTSSTLYTVTGTDSNNCSSMDTVMITVNSLPNIDAGMDQDVCDGDMVTLSATGGNTYSWNNGVMDGVAFLPTSTDYIVTGTDANSCVSMDTLSINLITIDTSVAVSGNILTANAASATYQWLDCDNGMAALPGETGISFTPGNSGNYAVAVTEMGCTDTSSCYNVTVVGIKSAQDLIDVEVYPNPTNGLIQVKVKGIETNGLSLQVIDLHGRTIFESRMTGEKSKQIDLTGNSAGIYFLRIRGESVTSLKKIVLR